MTRILVFCLFVLSFESVAEPTLRPSHWATPMINTTLDNFFLIDEGIYRSAQPDETDIPDLQNLGIKSVLNLRRFHDDQDELGDAAIKLFDVPMMAQSVSEKQIIQALKILKQKERPILVHCWHGSDRTGATVAAYRIIFNGWSKQQALDEMKEGGFGYHASMFPNLVNLIRDLDVDHVRRELQLNRQKP